MGAGDSTTICYLKSGKSCCDITIYVRGSTAEVSVYDTSVSNIFGGYHDNGG